MSENISTINPEDYPCKDAFTATVKAIAGITDAVERLDIYGDLEPIDAEYLLTHAQLVEEYIASGKAKRFGKTQEDVENGQEFYLDQLIHYASGEQTEKELFDELYKKEFLDRGEPQELLEYAGTHMTKLKSRAKRPKKAA